MLRFALTRSRVCVAVLMTLLLGATLIAGTDTARGASGRVTYQYDDAGRLKKVTYPDTSTKDYTLDPAGNRTQVQAIVPTGGVIAFEAGSVSPAPVSEGIGTISLTVTRTGQSTG